MEFEFPPKQASGYEEDYSTNVHYGEAEEWTLGLDISGIVTYYSIYHSIADCHFLLLL